MIVTKRIKYLGFLCENFFCIPSYIFVLIVIFMQYSKCHILDNYLYIVTLSTVNQFLFVCEKFSPGSREHISRTLVVVNQFIRSKSQIKVSANKSWFTALKPSSVCTGEFCYVFLFSFLAQLTFSGQGLYILCAYYLFTFTKSQWKGSILFS